MTGCERAVSLPATLEPPAPRDTLHPGSVRVLLLTTASFFLTFVVWFNMAPFNVVLKKALALTPAELGALMAANVALTIPARILIGRLVDRWGPRAVFSGLLVAMSVPCLAFALARAYWQLLLLRVLLSGIGAGFVVGIRMVAEWFPPHRVGTAEGIYAGWGNFGSAAAAFTLPLLALLFGGDEGWRWAVGLTGVASLAWGVVYFRSVRDTPTGIPYRGSSSGSLEVSSPGDLWKLWILTAPLYLVLGLLVGRIAASGILPGTMAGALYALLALAYLLDARRAWQVNRPRLAAGVPPEERYSFGQVAVLSLAYFATFGAELAVVSMLPQYFGEAYDLSLASAGAIASIFAFTNLFARPGGGWLADRFGRTRTLALLLLGLGGSFATLGAASLGGVPLGAAVGLVLLTSLFVQAGEGAVFALVPLVRKPLTGQIAGMVGAYGNAGAVVWLLVLQQLGPPGFFLALGAGGLLAFGLSLLLREPAVGPGLEPPLAPAPGGMRGRLSPSP